MHYQRAATTFSPDWKAELPAALSAHEAGCAPLGAVQPHALDVDFGCKMTRYLRDSVTIQPRMDLTTFG